MGGKLAGSGAMPGKTAGAVVGKVAGEIAEKLVGYSCSPTVDGEASDVVSTSSTETGEWCCEIKPNLNI